MQRKWFKAASTLIACLLVAITAPALAQDAPAEPAPVLAAADLRPGTDLSGSWHYSIDPYRAGLAGFHGGAPGASEARWAEIDVMEAMAADSRALFEFDMAAAPLATLPGSWVAHSPVMRHYVGLVWYQRHFPVRPQTGARAFLRFGAANYATKVYLNGKFVGEHEGGFTPFAFEVTDLLRDGDNQITVGVDSEASAQTVPPSVTDWENYGGITREIRLVQVPATYVDDAWVRLASDGGLAVDVALDGPEAANRPVALVIPELNLRLQGRTDANGIWRGSAPAPAGLVRWSPETPHLYDVAVEAGDDTWRERIGFRTIEVDGPEIVLNGRPIFMRGISIHEEELGSSPARAMTPAASRALLQEAKDGLHANFVRLAHYPHSEVTTRMADELGLLVWSEVPVYWRIDFANPDTLARARAMLAENIRRDRNRASIVVWSVANETPVTDARNAFLGRLVDDVRGLDDTRLVSAALLVKAQQEREVSFLALADPLASRLDILSINAYAGWYGPDRLADLASIEWRMPADKPLLFSEFGAGAKYGFHDLSADPQKFSEEFQADYYRATLDMVTKLPTLRGMSPWILKDFRSPRRQNAFQQGWNRKGLISETGQHKLAFDVLAEFYRECAARDGSLPATVSSANPVPARQAIQTADDACRPGRDRAE